MIWRTFPTILLALSVVRGVTSSPHSNAGLHNGLFNRDRYTRLGEHHQNQTDANTPLEKRAATCFPGIGFSKPALVNGVPPTPLSSWWCSPSTENGFFGFSYYVEWCQSKSELISDFTRMRTQFNARYVRLYSWCDWNDNFMNDVISAAYTAGIGVYSLIWFGFDGTDDWVWRRDLLIDVIKTNKLAPYVIRSVDVGSEPLYDWVLDPSSLAAQVRYVRSQIQSYGIPVSISEMQYGYTVQGDSQVVLNAIDQVHAHNLPFFDGDAKDGSLAWPSVYNSTTWFTSRTGNAKKVIFTQTGWPTNTNIWGPNSPTAVASVASAKAYADLLDSKCEALKAITPLGGVGWFWQIWNDAMLDGWGLLDWDENPKWNFAPRTAC